MSTANTARITWLGHATVLIQTGKGTNLLIDPFIGQNPSYPKGFELPSKIHYILLTHAHGDHISDALPVAARHGARIIAVHELAIYLASRGAADAVGMGLGGSVELDDVVATMVEAKHSSAMQDEHGVHYGGVAAGFVLSVAGGPVLYHAGDTAVFGDMKLIGDLYHPSVAMLPIGGHYTMGPREAALAVELLRPSVVLPIHFGTFPPLKGTPAELVACLDAKAEVVQWKPGESYTA